ncbi:MAG TPA: HAD family hydrolase [Candidatus Polarisedimenticolia bacterium]|nr:HAD family hydrolase [Candidatus Polarisedimenticolia bacterium]
MSRPAVFLDRDGTVCEEVGHVTSLSLCRLLPRSAAAIRALNQAGWPVFIVTNQSGVARGLFEESLVHEVHRWLRRSLAEQGAGLDGIYHCPHHPEAGEPPWRQACDCRKPLPGMLIRAAADHGLDLPASYLIGDSLRDLEAARGAGASGILVLTGHGALAHRRSLAGEGPPPRHVAADLAGAVAWILGRERKGSREAAG